MLSWHERLPASIDLNDPNRWMVRSPAPASHESLLMQP